MPTDYYRPIANAVGRLDPNTHSARRSIYDQARQLLFEEAQSADPPMGISELIREQRALEDAIQAVEEENVFHDNRDTFAEDEGFEPPARQSAPRIPAERPRAPQPDPRERLAAERENRLRVQEQRRLEVEERRAQRQGRAPFAPRPRNVRGKPSATVLVVSALLVALFLLGGAAGYVTIFGWPKFRAAQQAPQKKKEEAPAPKADENAAKARALVDQASRTLESGNPSGAIQLLTEAVVLSPKDANAYTLRGHSYLQAGDSAKAIEDFSEAIKLGSKDFYAYVGRAVAYRRIRDFPRSIADYNEAIKIRPDHAGAWNNRCFVQAIAGDLNNALADCNESLKLQPNEPNALDSRALVYLKQGKWDLAIADYDAVLKAAPNTVSALYGRGLAKVKKGDKRGQADISTATAAAPAIVQEFERYGVK